MTCLAEVSCNLLSIWHPIIKFDDEKKYPFNMIKQKEITDFMFCPFTYNPAKFPYLLDTNSKSDGQRYNRSTRLLEWQARVFSLC